MRKVLLFLLLVSSAVAQIVPGSGGTGGTITGQIQTATGGAIKGGTLTFTLSQPGIVSNTATLATQAVACYTSAAGNIAGVPDPAVAPLVSLNTVSGTLPAGTYYVEIYYYNASGNSVVSPETVAVLSSQGTINVNPPAFQPSSATGYGVAIGTTSGSETIQGTVTGFTVFQQSQPLIVGPTPGLTNTSSCNVYFSDQLVPTGTYYTVSLVNKNGTPIAGYPQSWCTYGGAGATINVSQGTPTGNCNVSGVFYPTPIFASPANNAAQSVASPISFPGGVIGNPTFPGGITDAVVGNVALKQFGADNVIYVSTLGNDSYDGLSWGTAKLTLAGALAALPSPGVVGWIKFGAGTFTFNNVTLPAAASNLESLRISGINTNRSAPNGGLAGGTIFSNTSTSNPTIVLGPGTAGVTIEGIYFTSTTLNSTTPHIFDNAGTSGTNAENYFVNDYFQGGGYGVQISAPGTGSNFETYILNSQFSQQTTDCVHITSLNQGQASQLTIQGSRCQLFGANGFYLTNASGVLIDNNQVTSNAGSTGDDIFINAGGSAVTTISNNELESLPTSNASTHCMNLAGNGFSIFGNSIFNTTFGIYLTGNSSTIGTNNFGTGASSTLYDVTLQSTSTANTVLPQSGAYPSGYFKDNSGTLTNNAFNDNGSGEDIMSGIVAATIGTRSNCAVNGVSPAACGSAPVGTVEVPTTTTTYTVNTTVVTAHSRILIMPTTDTADVGGTCNAAPTPFIAYPSARSVGVSFTFTLPSTTGTSCWTYLIIN